MRERTDEKNRDAPIRTDRERAKDPLKTRTDREGSIPVVEESVDVGKKSVETGGVRLESHVSERPVHEDVSLREEHVKVNRTPANRPLEAGDRDAFRERSIEMRETAERPVVSKQARVVEEVSLEKEVDTRTERISDTVRKTDVEVKPIHHQVSGRAGYESVTPKVRTHFDQNYGRSGANFENYDRAYRYGYELSGDDRLSNSNWSSVEPHARETWESQNKGTWDTFKDAVRHGFGIGR